MKTVDKTPSPPKSPQKILTKLSNFDMESLAIPIVNQILGDYISNLNSNQLKIGLWDGNVKLENLKLKKEMLSQFKIPLEVVYGI